MSDAPKAEDSKGVKRALGIELTPSRIAFIFLLGILLTLLEIQALEFAWEKLGVPHRYFFTLLFFSLFGSMVNLPLFSLPADSATAGAKPTVVAINLGGALIPTGLALWIVAKQADPIPALLAVAIVSASSFFIARPIKGLGIAMPMFVPPLIAAGAALLLNPTDPAGAAYAGGTLGTLIGADLLNLRKIGALGAPLVSIGGAGTFDGVFLSGILAVVLALW